MFRVGLLLVVVFIVLFSKLSYAQSGIIIERGDQVLDPNQDGFISISNTGFSGDNYDVDEFEITMFGIPIFGDGEVIGDTQSGAGCGVTDLALDSAGYALYAGFDAAENLIFRFRLSDNHPSVQSYSILIDTDQLVGSADPNASSENPGFEIAITLIQKFGVYLYDIDGLASCPTPLRTYNINTNQQKSTSAQQSCGTTDIYIDFYLPFNDLTSEFGITPSSNLRFVGVSNVSATCALDGSISDIGGVDDTNYNGCFSCAILDITENQCPTSIDQLCNTCGGFPIGFTATPEITTPILVNDINISGKATPEASIYIELYSNLGVLIDRDTTLANIDSTWISNNFIQPLQFGDSVVVNAFLPGRCLSGLDNAGLSFAIVTPDTPPILTGSLQTLSYLTEGPPILLAEDISITDDNNALVSATIRISQNYEISFDLLDAIPSANISVSYSAIDGVLSLDGTAALSEYQAILRSVIFYNTSSTPNLEVREITITVNDGSSNSQPFVKNIIIAPLNELPSITGSADTLNYTEGDGSVIFDNLLAISDPDDTVLVSATITFISGYSELEDTLIFTDQNGIISNFSNGALTLIGTTSLANYQSALRSILYENRSAAPSTSERQVEVIINDGSDNSLPFVRIINIVPIIEPPVIEVLIGGGTTTTLSYTEGDGILILLPDLSLKDADDINLEGATVSFTENYNAFEDLISLTPLPNIQFSFDQNSGVINLTGSATLGDYLASLRTISYENTSENPSNLPRTLEVFVLDGDTISNSLTITINVIPVNDAPFITGNNARLIYPESTGQAIVEPSIVPNDVDNVNLVGATIAIVNNYHNSEDHLAYALKVPGIEGSFEPSTGILRLTGTAPKSDYETALQNITYSNSEDIASQGIRTIEIKIDDGNLSSTPYIIEIEIIEVEDPVVIYQIVTPNADGINDQLIIDGILQFPQNKVQIFNRWNALVFETTGYDNDRNSWTGRANTGMTKGDLPEGTYFYIVDIGDGSKLRQGFVLLKKR